jgi:hypothetical protein
MSRVRESIVQMDYDLDGRVLVRLGDFDLVIERASVTSASEIAPEEPQRDALYLSQAEQVILGKMAGWVLGNLEEMSDEARMLLTRLHQRYGATNPAHTGDHTPATG